LPEFRDGKSEYAAGPGITLQGDDSVWFTRLQALVPAVQVKAQEDFMLLRSYFLHYRLIRELVTGIAIVGTALLFSYLILQA
jgi:hypothetical protein